MSWIDPNYLTIIGMLLCVLAGCLFIVNKIFLAGIFVLLGGIFDVLDGVVARANDKSTCFGEFLDSVSDRFGDAAIFIGLTWSGLLYIKEFPGIPEELWGFLAIVGSIMVSYTRAKAEALGVKIKTGIANRPFRILAISFVAIFLSHAISYIIILITILCFITIGQRILEVRRKLQIRKLQSGK